MTVLGGIAGSGFADYLPKDGRTNDRAMKTLMGRVPVTLFRSGNKNQRKTPHFITTTLLCNIQQFFTALKTLKTCKPHVYYIKMGCKGVHYKDILA